ncbi:aldo/keto reductase [Haladaptatus sp. GCM10025707]|uniref:aldo/keto reductase n=1 Tax=unclassified Haladaptatus TaxID=2622732 RepID=UPI0023E8DFE2|nr:MULTISPECIES: aldo/keto reductase [unclassified Haladaptatus]
MNDLPAFGLGTYLQDDHDQCVASVETALDVGYRHIDTAQEYGNEAAAGEAIENAAVPREDVFLASKVETGNLAYEDVLSTTRESLDRLGVDTLDLLYVHWPLGEYDPEGTLRAFDELYDDGLIRHVGLSNFTPDLLDEALGQLSAPLYAHQVEMNPLCQQDELRAMAENEDHHFVAYSPLAQDEVFDIPELQEIASEHDVSEAQVSLAWLREKGAKVIPKATSREHIADNFAARDLTLTDADIAKIDGIEREERTVEFDAAPWNQ